MMAVIRLEKNILNKINKIYKVQEQHVNDGLPVFLSICSISHHSPS